MDGKTEAMIEEKAEEKPDVKPEELNKTEVETSKLNATVEDAEDEEDKKANI